MGSVTHGAGVVAEFDVGMVVFTVCHPDDAINKCGGLVVVLEAKLALDVCVLLIG